MLKYTVFLSLRLVILCISILSFSTIKAQIIETDSFKEILHHVDSDSLVILDIDDTLLIPIQTLGTDVWFIHRLDQYKKVYPFEEALDKTLADWEAVRHLTRIKIVEEGTEAIIRHMQDSGICVMGLTTQGLALATRTVHQLASIGISLSLTAPSKEDIYFINKHGILYRQGILFTSGTPKGPAFVKLVNKMQYLPKKIVFINDKRQNLEDLRTGADALGIPFIGLRYAYSDERVRAFDPKIAEVQWEYSSFGHILSDEEAKKMIECQDL